MIAQQFGNPRGVLGRLVGHLMARGNAAFNRWLVQQLTDQGQDQELRIVELGPGPGIGLEEALRVFPNAHVWGVDSSGEMLDQSRRRNHEYVDTGRLTLLQGDTSSLAALAPLDLVFAVHVLYFWRRPDTEFARIKGALFPPKNVFCGNARGRARRPKRADRPVARRARPAATPSSAGWMIPTGR